MVIKIFCTLNHGLECTKNKCDTACEFYDKKKGNVAKIEAAWILKNNCTISCKGCPFSKSHTCIISEYETPAGWKLEEINGK